MTSELLNKLYTARANLQSSIRVSEEYDKMFASCNEELEKQKTKAAVISEVANYLTALYKEVKSHEIERQAHAFDIFNQAIQDANKYIPDSKLQSMRLIKEDDGNIAITNSLGGDLNSREGLGARTCVGILLRYIALSQNYKANKIMFFDEGLFSIDTDNIHKVKEMFKEMSRDCLIVITEQRRAITEGLACDTFLFKLENGITNITRQEHKENEYEP